MSSVASATVAFSGLSIQTPCSDDINSINYSNYEAVAKFLDAQDEYFVLELAQNMDQHSDYAKNFYKWIVLEKWTMIRRIAYEVDDLSKALANWIVFHVVEEKKWSLVPLCKPKIHPFLKFQVGSRALLYSEEYLIHWPEAKDEHGVDMLHRAIRDNNYEVVFKVVDYPFEEHSETILAEFLPKLSFNEDYYVRLKEKGVKPRLPSKILNSPALIFLIDFPDMLKEFLREGQVDLTASKNGKTIVEYIRERKPLLLEDPELQTLLKIDKE